MFDRVREWVRGHPRDVAITGGLGVLAFAVAVGTLSAVAGRDANPGAKPLIAEPGPGRRAATAPGPATGEPTAVESAQAVPLAPASSASPIPTPSRSPSPMPMAAGQWSGVASVTVTGQDFGCTAVTKTFRRPAMFRLDHPLPGEDNAVHLSLRTSQQEIEGSFAVDSSTASTSATRYWTLSGDGVGGLIGRLTGVAPTPLGGQPPVDNVLTTTKSLDKQCGTQISAPVEFPLGPGAALRATLTGKRTSVRISGETADHTRTFQIAFRSS
jgi:hypothetical protein